MAAVVEYDGPVGLDPGPSVLDALVFPDETAAGLAACRPGPDAVVALSALGPQALSAAGRVDTLVAVERQQRWLAGVQQRLLAAMVAEAEARSDRWDEHHDPSGLSWLAEEVACALRLAPSTVEGRLHTATDLVRRLPDTLAAVETGAVSMMHAKALSEATCHLPPATSTRTLSQRWRAACWPAPVRRR